MWTMLVPNRKEEMKAVNGERVGRKWEERVIGIVLEEEGGKACGLLGLVWGVREL